MGSEQLYSVPSVLVFRSWASNADPDAVIKRRLLLKNDSQRTLSFRLSLPQHPAFQVSGSLVPDAAPGDVCSVTLPAGGSTSLTVTLARQHADEIECRDELCVRMADGWLYVPLVALRDTQQPEGGDPSERRTVPGGGEYWSDADSDDEQRKPSVQRRSSPSQGAPVKGRGRSDGKLTAAAVTEADELDFYAELLKAGPARPAVPPRAANAGEPPSPSSTSSTPARAPHAPPTPQPASRPSSSYEGVQGISQRFSRGAQVRMVKLDASPARVATPRAEAASIAHVAPEWGEAPPHCDTDELAFYRSLLPRHGGGGPPLRREGSGPVVDPKASARAEARAAIEAGTYFVISGSVCDARGKEIGSVDEVLGPEHAQHGGGQQGGQPASDLALDPAASLREVTSSSSAKLSHAKLGGHHQGQPPYMRSDPAQISVPAARKGRPDDRILGRGKGDILGLKGNAKGDLGGSAVIKGGGTVVKSAAPKANYLLTERDMQANWDALC